MLVNTEVETVTLEPTTAGDPRVDLTADVLYTVQNQGSIDVNFYIGENSPDLESDDLEHYVIFGKTETNFSITGSESAYAWTNHGSTSIYTIEAPG